jgi:hypothetical protein
MNRATNAQTAHSRLAPAHACTHARVFTCTALTLLCFSFTVTPAHADVPLDGFYEVDGYFPYFIIEDGTLKNASGFLLNPVCKDGGIQAPALITDLHAFFEGQSGTRVVDRGNGSYLLTSSIELDESDSFRQIRSGTISAIYAEIEFDSPTEGTFTLRVATAFLTGAGMGTSTCLAKASFELNRVNS